MPWQDQVEIKLDRLSAGDRLHRIEGWCADWQIGFRIHGTVDPVLYRVAFEDARFARAFHCHFGGVIVPVDDIDMAFGADATEVDLYDRLAGEYPD